MSEEIKVLIVDDHEMVREGLTTMLKTIPEFELVGTASDGEKAVLLCQQSRPDVILMDLEMPHMDGVTAARSILEMNPDTKIIALTSFSENDRIQAALQAGMISYLTKNVQASKLADAIRSAHRGKSTLSSEAAQVLIQASVSPKEIGFDLTDREMEVLELLVEGCTNAQIAQELIISISTAKFHVSTILSKLNAASRTEAVSLALRHNLLKKP